MLKNDKLRAQENFVHRRDPYQPVDLLPEDQTLVANCRNVSKLSVQ